MKIRQTTASTTTIIAIGSTLAFYLVAPVLPGVSDFVQRYFCSHPLEYISTAMFFTGIAILLQKFRRLRSERLMLTVAQEAADGGALANCEASQRESVLAAWCEDQRPLRNTQLYVRMQDVLHYLIGSRREGLEEHLRYLAELASERLHQTYATIRTITWAIPILGFLGTVIGITMAIANVTPEQLDSSLKEVTGGLAVAFDTTALALGMSIVMVFASFIVERTEQQLLNDIEQFGIEALLPWFGSSGSAAASRSPLLAGVNEELLRAQTEIWSSQLAQMGCTWDGLLQQHAQTMKEALSEEVQETLKLHRETSTDARDTYAAALQQSSQTVVRQTEAVLMAFTDRINQWQEALLTSSQSSTQQSEALHDLGATLLRMTESEERLAQLQKLLTDNLQALRVADTMEQTANSLTAAVHILTARASGRSAA